MTAQEPRRRTNAPRRTSRSTPEQLCGLRENLAVLAESEDALVRGAARFARDELDLADLADDPNPHLAQVARILDAVLRPDDEPREVPDSSPELIQAWD
jgi:hypothetical protein